MVTFLCCSFGGAVCWRPVIGLPAQSVVVGEVGFCVGLRWRADGGVGVLRTGPEHDSAKLVSVDDKNWDWGLPRTCSLQF